MKITRIEIENYRNIENMEFSPCDGVNIIYGDNAQGKTNLMEALWLFYRRQKLSRRLRS